MIIGHNVLQKNYPNSKKVMVFVFALRIIFLLRRKHSILVNDLEIIAIVVSNTLTVNQRL